MSLQGTGSKEGTKQTRPLPHGACSLVREADDKHSLEQIMEIIPVGAECSEENKTG